MPVDSLKERLLVHGVQQGAANARFLTVGVVTRESTVIIWRETVLPRGIQFENLFGSRASWKTPQHAG